jgi:hypothetical protein
MLTRVRQTVVSVTALLSVKNRRHAITKTLTAVTVVHVQKQDVANRLHAAMQKLVALQVRAMVHHVAHAVLLNGTNKLNGINDYSHDRNHKFCKLKFGA